MKRVVIFGANGGLGSALTEIYQNNAWEVIPVTRADCDLSNPKQVACISEKLKNEEFDTCIFCSGYSEVGYIEDVPLSAFYRSFEINAFSIIKIFKTLADYKKKSVKFVFVLSGAADFLITALSPYSLSKRFLRDFLYILNLEKGYQHHKMISVYPGSMRTRFAYKHKVYGKPKLFIPKYTYQPDYVSKKIFSDVELKNKKEICLSYLPRILGKIQRIFCNL